MTFPKIARCNTIPTNVEPEYPGDLTLEPRGRRGGGGGFSSVTPRKYRKRYLEMGRNIDPEPSTFWVNQRFVYRGVYGGRCQVQVP